MADKKRGKRIIGLRLDDDLLISLREFAARLGESVSAAIRIVLRERLGREEAAYWANSDVGTLDGKEIRVATARGARTQAISIRLPEHLLATIRHSAARKDVPYQRLMRRALEQHFPSKRAKGERR